jgi:hypothetical protein
MAAFKRNAGCMGTTVISFLIKQFPVKKMKRETARCHDTTGTCFVSKVPDEVFARFHVVTAEVKAVCETICLACQVELFMNHPYAVKTNMMSMLLMYLFAGFALIGLGEFGLPVCCSGLLNPCLIITKAFIALSRHLHKMQYCSS